MTVTPAAPDALREFLATFPDREPYTIPVYRAWFVRRAPEGPPDGAMVVYHHPQLGPLASHYSHAERPWLALHRLILTLGAWCRHVGCLGVHFTVATDMVGYRRLVERGGAIPVGRDAGQILYWWPAGVRERRAQAANSPADGQEGVTDT